MPVALEQFVKQLEDSGILAGDTLKDFIPPKATPKDAEELARELVRNKVLTRFQAEEVYKGKARSLVLGNYVLMEKIGAGGMGQVFKARHRRMDRIVAVKLLPAEMTKDQAAIARFEREVMAAAKISHPNIVTAYDADQADGVRFLVMECVEGSDLSAVVKKNGPFPVDKAVNYILQAARGLEAAHARGIVHRDIKPANLLLDKQGTVKILDMGLARLSGASDDPTEAELTKTGTIMGTVDYMAPEQALNTKTADARADIYSLGCSLYYLIAGRATYGGDTLTAKLLAHQNQSIPSLRDARPEVPEQIDAIFRRMLAKSVEDRYQSATELIADLEQCSSRPEPSINTQPSFGSSTDAGLTNFLQDISVASKSPALLKPGIALQNKDWLYQNKRPLLIAGGVLGVLALLLGVIISLKTKDGTLIVKINEPDTEVQVLSEEGEVQITRSGDKGRITISVVPGKHQLRVKKDGFAVLTKEFEIEENGEQTITAKLVPLDDQPAVAGETPAPVPAGEKKPLAFTTPGFDQWVEEVAAMPAEQQVKAVAKKLVELNPGFDGKVTHGIENGAVTGLQFISDDVVDISPVRALAELRTLNCSGTESGKRTLADLSPIAGMPLTGLYCSYSSVFDILPLRGMPLAYLEVFGTQVSELSPLKGMSLTVLDCHWTQVSDLSPLSGMPMSALYFYGTPVSNLSPLKGMPLVNLYFHSTRVADPSPIKDMPLQQIHFDFKPFRDTELLSSIKTLATINIKPAAEFWQEVETQQAAFDKWTEEVRAMPAAQQVEAVSKKLVELNPGFDGNVTPTIERGVVTGFGFLTDNVTDISPVRALLRLERLDCGGSSPGKGQLTDMSPLKDMKLTMLAINSTAVYDLSPLRGMPLTSLVCFHTMITDISALQGLPLTNLACHFTKVSDLTPLKGMPLQNLHCKATSVTDLFPLKDMQLTQLNCALTNISDLSPLKDMPLKALNCDFSRQRDTELLRSIKTLETINDKPAAEFWKEVETQQAALDQWVKEVAALPAEQQVEAVSKKLVELNPGYDGKVTHAIENSVVVKLELMTDVVTDISPVRALASLKQLMCQSQGQGQLADLSPLKGLSMTLVGCAYNPVSDLSPLKGMPLTFLNCSDTQVSDLSPLTGMPLSYLAIARTQVSDIAPLKGMPLGGLVFDGTEVSDISPLIGMTTLVDLACGNTKVTDFSPLTHIPLKKLWLDFKPERDTALLRSIKTLETINGKPVAEFWTEVEATNP